MRRGTVLPIAVMALAITGFVFIVFWAATPGLKWPWSIHISNTNSSNYNATSNTSDHSAQRCVTDIDCQLNACGTYNRETHICQCSNAKCTLHYLGPGNILVNIDNTSPSLHSDWKTYTNNTLGYSFQYPKDWSVRDIDNGDFISILPPYTTPVSNTNAVAGDCCPTPAIGLSVVESIANDPPFTQNKTTLVINGVAATQQEHGGFGNALETYFPLPDGKFLKFVWEKSLGTATHDAIIHSVVLPRAVTGWKTYRNATWDYSFEYPNTLKFEQSTLNSQFMYASDVVDSPDPNVSSSLPMLSVQISVYDHRTGQAIDLNDYDRLATEHRLPVKSGSAVWGPLQSNDPQNKLINSQLQFHGQEQDILVQVTERGVTEPVLAPRIFTSFTAADQPSTLASYRLTCDTAPFSGKAITRQTWWTKFSSQIIQGWELEAVCLNADRDQVVYDKSKIDTTGQGNGQEQIGVYSIAADSFVKATPRRSIYGSECAHYFSWDKKSGVITYHCSAGDAGAYWYGYYTFDPVTQANATIKECSGDAESNKETCR